MREIEKKYEVENFDSLKEAIEEKIKTNELAFESKVYEENSLYDIFSIIRNSDCVLRTRYDGKYTLTIKGRKKKNKYNENEINKSYIKDRFELNIDIPKKVNDFLPYFFTCTGSYEKIRETYFPTKNPNCKICLDELVGVGNFVEIESCSISEILHWEKIFGLEHAIKESYMDLKRANEKRT